METLAYIYNVLEYEDPTPNRAVRSFAELNLPMPSPAMMGAFAVGVTAAAIGAPEEAQALMYYGDQGTGVSQLQEQLGIAADGIFGPQTYDSVLAFQRRQGLLVDGVAGPETLTALGLPPDLGPGNGSESGVSGNATVVAGSGLLVRNAPAGSVIGSLYYGQTVSVTGARESAEGLVWAQLSSGGWVAEQYLSFGGSGGGGGEQPIGGSATVTAGGGLLIRNSPGYTAVIGSLAYGETVSLTGATSYADGRNWSQLSGGGWVASSYLSGGGGGEQPIESGAYVTAGSGLLIREAPGYSTVIGSLAYQENVALSGAERYVEGRNWLQLAGGGWVAADYIGYR